MCVVGVVDAVGFDAGEGLVFCLLAFRVHMVTGDSSCRFVRI
jgi:hypothetical protein